MHARPSPSPRAPRPAPSLTLTLALALVAAPAVAQSPVFVVDDDGGPGVDFTSLAAAVTAAPDGAVLLVAGGTYAGFDLAGKSLHVVADGGLVRVEPSTVSGLGAGDAVLLQGLDFVPNASGAHEPLLVVDAAAGPVLLDGTTFALSGVLWPQPLLRASGAAALTVTDSEFLGSEGSQFLAGGGPFFPNDAISAADSALALYDVIAAGGSGADGFWTGFDTFVANHPGHHGLALDGGSAFLGDVELVGGQGGDGAQEPTQGSCLFPREGGDGLHVTGGGVVTGLGAGFEAGPGGGSGFGDPCGVGAPGDATEILDGTLDVVAGSVPKLSATSPVREGAVLTVGVAGTPGDTVILLASAAQSPLPLPKVSGVLLPAAPFLELTIGTVGGGGTLSLPFGVPDLGPGVESVVVYLQAVSVSGGGTFTASSPAAAVLVDAAF